MNSLSIINDTITQQINFNCSVDVKLEPTVTTNICNPHPAQYITLKEAEDQFKKQKQIQCPHCQKIVKSLSELSKSIHWLAKEQFHNTTNQISIIQGLLVGKYIRQKRYQDYIMETSIFIDDLISRSKNNQSKAFQINEILQQCPDRKYIEIYCGLDKIRINIPVRIIKCQNHVECYELTSLLAYMNENKIQKQQNEVVKFSCQYCDQEYQWKEYADIYSMLIIDLELLKAINKSVPFSQQLIYDSNKKELRDSSVQPNGETLDYQIQAYYKEFKLQTQYPLFQEKVIQSVSACTNGAIPDKILKTIKEKQIEQKFKTFNIDLLDKLTNQIIQYPARCFHCTDLTKCLDLRSIISDFQNEQSKTTKYFCRLCNHEYKTTSTLSNSFYIDYNILQKINGLYGQNGLNQLQLTNFLYDGKQTLLDEFKNKQKYRYQEYVKAYNQQQKKNDEIVKISNFYCALMKEELLKNPLGISACSTVIEFETFYKWFSQTNFNINAILDICKCGNCNEKKKKVVDGIYYHEALAMALKAYEKIQNKKEFQYDFASKSVVGFNLLRNQQQNYTDKNLKDLQHQQGFSDLISDQQYQLFFSEKHITGANNQQFKFKVENMKQEFCGVVVQFNQEGIQGNFDEEADNLNKQIQQNENLQKWNFKIQKIEYEVDKQIFQPQEKTD